MKRTNLIWKYRCKEKELGRETGEKMRKCRYRVGIKNSGRKWVEIVYILKK